MAKILMVASEARPFCMTGGLADVIGALPAALAAQGEEVAVVLPGYRDNRYPGALREAYRGLAISIGPGYLVDIYEAEERGVKFYFVHCPPLYGRDGIYGAGGADFGDNFMRYAVLSMAALGVIRNLFRPHIVHCHDWQAALTGAYMRRLFRNDPTFDAMKIVFTIHNLGYQGVFGRDVMARIALDPGLFNPGQMEFNGALNYLKGGVYFADAVTTVSEGYAREIQTTEYGFGLDGFLRAQNRLSGIVNGVDYSEWNPETDPHIPAAYTEEDLSGKRECKRALLAEFGLPEAALDRPLIGMITRFASQKGMDLIGDIFPQLIDEDLSLVVLGSGDRQYESMFNYFHAARPDKVGVWIGYSNPLAHRIEAGADMFLMPSRYEPCGLNQIYSLRYGAVPVVRATGGLDDTIDEGTGFKFWEYSGWALLGAVRAALNAYGDAQEWQAMALRGMRKDYSWEASARRYSGLYARLRAA